MKRSRAAARPIGTGRRRARTRALPSDPQAVQAELKSSVLRLWVDYELTPRARARANCVDRELERAKSTFLDRITDEIADYRELLPPEEPSGRASRGSQKSTTSERVDQLDAAARKFFRVLHACLNDSRARRTLASIFAARSASPLRREGDVLKIERQAQVLETHFARLRQSRLMREAKRELRAPRPRWQRFAARVVPLIEQLHGATTATGTRRNQKLSTSKKAEYVAELLSVAGEQISVGNVRNWLRTLHK